MDTSWSTIGFDGIKTFFDSLINGGQLAHAYLFTGQEMIGKRTFAVELADKISSLRSSTSQPEVELLNDGLSVNPDILLITPEASESKQSITIDEARRIKNFISLRPYSGERKVVIIDDAQSMTTEAQNALLKVLEEPASSSMPILVASSCDTLLPTIVSRCQEVKFPFHPKSVIEEVLANSKLTKSQKGFILEFSNGRVGLAKKIIEERLYGDIEKSIKDLIHLIKSNINDRLNIAQKFTEDKNKDAFTQKVFYWQLYMRMRLNEPKVSKILRGLLDLHETISHPQFNHRLALEAFLVNL